MDGKNDGGYRGDSNGERQLLAICRAVLRGGKIVIFDEITSALNEMTSRLMMEVRNTHGVYIHVVQMLHQHFKHATVITITHQVENLSHVDRWLICPFFHSSYLQGTRSRLWHGGRIRLSLSIA